MEYESGDILRIIKDGKIRGEVTYRKSEITVEVIGPSNPRL